MFGYLPVPQFVMNEMIDDAFGHAAMPNIEFYMSRCCCEYPHSSVMCSNV